MSLTLSFNNYAFGQIRIHQPKSVVVQLVNNTDKPISAAISKVGCGSCTSAKLDTNEVPPNGKINMTVTFTPNSTGINRKSVTINSNLIFSFNAVVY